MSGRIRNYPSTPVDVWCCLNPAHQEVYWRGDVAACADCGLTSQMTAEFASESAQAERECCITELEKYGWTLPAAILMKPLLPSLSQVYTWMGAHGWHAGLRGRAGSMWSHPDGHQFGVLDDDGADERYLADTVQRLAFAHDRPIAEVLAEMRACASAEHGTKENG